MNSASPDPAIVDQFIQAVTDPSAQPVFVHCASGNRAAALWMTAATVIYLVGCFAVTVFVNVPMNEALAAIDARAVPDAGAGWRDYAGPWTAWNHVRTAACAGGFLCALAALWRWPG